MATPLTKLASFPAASRSASVATRPDSVTTPFAGLTFTLVAVEKRASRKSSACNASLTSAVSSCALRGCVVLQPAPPRTATTDTSTAANATEVVLLLPLQFLPVFIERPLLPRCLNARADVRGSTDLGVRVAPTDRRGWTNAPRDVRRRGRVPRDNPAPSRRSRTRTARRRPRHIRRGSLCRRTAP